MKLAGLSQAWETFFLVTHFYLHFRLTAKNSINFSSKASEHLVLPPLSLSALWSSFPLQSSSVSSLHSSHLYTLSLSLSQQLEKGNTPAGLLLKEVMNPYEENLLKSSFFFPLLFTKTDDRFSLACPGEKSFSLYHCCSSYFTFFLDFFILIWYWDKKQIGLENHV